MNKLLTFVKYNSAIISKLYFDIYHKSSLGVLITLLIILFPENDKVYFCSELIAVYSIILIFSDFGINQLLYKSYSKLVSSQSFFYIRKICTLYVLKITLNFFFTLFIGQYLARRNLFDLKLIISMSIWIFFYQLTAQPLISALQRFSLLLKSALYSQLFTLLISVSFFLITYNWYYVLILYPALLSLSVAIFSWMMFLKSLVTNESNVILRLKNYNFNLIFKIFKKSIRNINIILSGSLTWSNTIATVFLYQVPIIILSSYASRASTTDLSYGISYLTFPLVFLRLNAVFLTLAQYLLQYKVSDYTKIRFFSSNYILNYLKRDFSFFRENLFSLTPLLLLAYLIFCCFLYLKYQQSPFLLTNLLFLFVLSPIILFFRMSRIFINKMIVSFGSSILSIYAFNIISIVLSLILIILIATYDYIFKQYQFGYFILFIGLLLDYSFYTFTMIKLDGANK